MRDISRYFVDSFVRRFNKSTRTNTLFVINLLSGKASAIEEVSEIGDTLCNPLTLDCYEALGGFYIKYGNLITEEVDLSEIGFTDSKKILLMSEAPDWYRKTIYHMISGKFKETSEGIIVDSSFTISKDFNLPENLSKEHCKLLKHIYVTLSEKE